MGVGGRPTAPPSFFGTVTENPRAGGNLKGHTVQLCVVHQLGPLLSAQGHLCPGHFLFRLLHGAAASKIRHPQWVWNGRPVP